MPRPVSLRFFPFLFPLFSPSFFFHLLVLVLEHDDLGEAVGRHGVDDGLPDALVLEPMRGLVLERRPLPQVRLDVLGTFWHMTNKPGARARAVVVGGGLARWEAKHAGADGPPTW